MKSRPWWFYKQSAVVPYRLKGDEPEILLITSIRKGRWIVPKGVIDLGTTARDSAAKEAFEEAGIKGRMSDEPFGEYSYEKWGGTCRVQLFLLEVETVLDEWPEAAERRREWMTPEEAARRVDEDELKQLILSLPGNLDTGRRAKKSSRGAESDGAHQT